MPRLFASSSLLAFSSSLFLLLSTTSSLPTLRQQQQTNTDTTSTSTTIASTTISTTFTSSFGPDIPSTVSVLAIGNASECNGVAIYLRNSDNTSIPLPPDLTLIDGESKEGSGAGAPVGYCLVENRPRCYFTLGSRYCPAPPSGQTWTDFYMSYLQRTSQVLTNMARMDPTNFRRLYYGGASYACSVGVRAPLRYSPNCHQAALKQSQILSDSSCPFQHDTCSKYCSLYGRCNWDARISKYEPSWTSIGENIAWTDSTKASDPLAALTMWLGSSGHCSSIFSGGYNHMGTGSVGRYWTQVFVARSASTTNPMYDGTHYLSGSRTGGKLRFLVTFRAGSTPKSVTVYVNGAARTMTRHLGSTTQGAYAFDMSPPSSGCLSYYFRFVSSAGSAYTLPQTGSFRTTRIAGCNSNWVSTRSGTAKEDDEDANAPEPVLVAVAAGIVNATVNKIEHLKEETQEKIAVRVNSEGGQEEEETETDGSK